MAPPLDADRGALLTAYDAQLRDSAETARADSVVRHGPVWWARFGSRGFVTYRDLGGLSGEALDRLIAETVAHFRDETDVARFEWKTRGHDRPVDHGARLAAQGVVADEIETVMIGPAALLAKEPGVPAGVVLRQAGQGGDLAADVRRAGELQSSVFGEEPDREYDEEILRAILDGQASGAPTMELWLAEVNGQVVSAGRLELVEGTEFGGLWGGATAEAWRGRGLYRALVAARARSALVLGARYLYSDCSSMSRPILERSGLTAVTSTTPYLWTRPV